MNRYMQIVATVAVAGVLAGGSTAVAAEKTAAKPAHPAKAQVAKGGGIAAKSKELTLTGIVAKTDVKVAGKNRTGYVLITPSGAKVRLPVAKAGKNAAAAPAIKLADYLNQNVKVVAMGTEQKKGDKVVVRVKTLKAIEKAAQPGEGGPAKVG